MNFPEDITPWIATTVAAIIAIAGILFARNNTNRTLREGRISNATEKFIRLARENTKDFQQWKHLLECGFLNLRGEFEREEMQRRVMNHGLPDPLRCGPKQPHNLTSFLKFCYRNRYSLQDGPAVFCAITMYERRRRWWQFWKVKHRG